LGKMIVVPGELVCEERKKLGEHVYIHNGKIYSDCLGITNNEATTASVVPLEGKYKPVMGDVIIGIVTGERIFGYSVDINSFYQSFINKKDLRERLNTGAIVSAKVMNVNEINEVELGEVRYFYGGDLISVSPVKVPRLIGKNGSMLDVLKHGTGCSVAVGRNGWCWAKGPKIELLVKAIQKIEAEAHLSNLTNKMQEFLAKENPNPAPAQESAHAPVPSNESPFRSRFPETEPRK